MTVRLKTSHGRDLVGDIEKIQILNSPIHMKLRRKQLCSEMFTKAQVCEESAWNCLLMLPGIF
uniref:Uncharacterized protein n=1 Tax=Onchocerca volvulus TaxID=6282 RepID=A0A8R1XW49_ONCVO